MSNLDNNCLAAHGNTRTFWCGALYLLLLCFDIGAILVLATDSEPELASYHYESGFETSDESTSGLATPIPRAPQAANFSHPIQTTKIFRAIDISHYPNHTRFCEYIEDRYLSHVQWHQIESCSPNGKLSGWKDSNILFRSLSLART